MSEEFVRKDYHDATMREIKALMEQNLAKQEAMNAKQEAAIATMSARQEAIITDIRGEIRNIHTRIDGVVNTFSVAIEDLKQAQSNGFAKWGITVAIIVGVVQVTLTLLLR